MSERSGIRLGLVAGARSEEVAVTEVTVDRFRGNVAQVADQMRCDDGTGRALQVLQG